MRTPGPAPAAALGPNTSLESGVPDTDRVVEVLEAAGFPAERIEVTASVTPTGLDADSLDVAVRLDDECLVGQFMDGYRSEVLDPVNDACLIGQTVDLSGS